MKQNNSHSNTKPFKVAIVSLYSVKNLGARYVHEYLRTHNVDSDLFFFKDININDYKAETEEEIECFIKKVKSENYNFVGLSVGCSAFADLAKKLTLKLKSETNSLVIWGGVHPTIVPDGSIEYADMICVGEGEKPLLELSERMQNNTPYTDIPNLWVKSGESVHKNDIRTLAVDIDDLPWPKYDDSNTYFINNDALQNIDPIKQIGWEYVIMTARGCPYQCSYCVNNLYWKMYKNKGKYIRQRSVENVISELLYAIKTFTNIKKVAFYDDVFGLDLQWTKEFAKQYKSKIQLPFWCYVHPQSVKKANLEVLKDAGLYMVDIGLQSGSEKIRKEVLKRGGSNEKFKKAIKTVHDIGIVPLVDVIADNPYETEEDKKITFELLLSIRPFNLVMFTLAYFPVTELTRRALKEGLIEREDVDDMKKNVFYSWRAKILSGKDSKENAFWKSLIILSAKDFVSISFLKYVSRQTWIKERPNILAPLVFASNYIKWFGVGIKLLLQGQVNISLIRQWAKYVFTVGS